MSGDFRSRRAAWGRATVLLVGLAVLVGLAIAVVVALSKGPEIGGVVAGAVATALAFPMLTVALWAWWRRGLPSEATAPGPVATVKDELAKKVADQWREEEQIRSLGRWEPMPVSWGLTSDPALLMGDPVRIFVGGAVTWSGSSDRIEEVAEQFRGLRCRRLVALGGPGTGKTTLAVQLLRELLRTLREGEPVPVLLSVASWDTAAFPSLQDWLVVRLAEGYPWLRTRGGGLETCRALVKRREVLPVLDGLDEVSPAARAGILTALNEGLVPEDQFIVTCRTDEYARAVAEASVLAAAAVIEPEPLSPASAADYLASCLFPVPVPWQDVLARLRDGRAAHLAEAIATPLGLWLVLKTYAETAADPVELLDSTRFPTASALRAHLFDQLIPQVIRARKKDRSRRLRHCRDAETTVLWLSRFALYLDRVPTHNAQTGTRDFAWWRLARHSIAPGYFWLTYLLSVCVVLGAAAGTVTGAMAGITAGAIVGPVTAWLAGVLAVVVALVSAGVQSMEDAVPWQDDRPGHSDLSLRGLTRRSRAGLLGELAAEAWREELGPRSLAEYWAESRGNVLLQLRQAAKDFARLVGSYGGLLLIAWLTCLVTDWAEWAEFILIFLIVVPLGWLVVCSLLVGGLAFVALGAAALVLTPGLLLPAWEIAVRDDRASTPMSTWRGDRTLNLLRPAVLGGLGALLGSVMGLTGYTTFWLVLGLTAGLFTSLAVSRHRAWLVYLMVTTKLAWRRHLPLRLMPFLDEAHRLGLLRAVGPLYQFRHAELHDHLAAKARQRSEA
ncbi:NACHT domain-containing protein [Streptomyces chartreusis]